MPRFFAAGPPVDWSVVKASLRPVIATALVGLVAQVGVRPWSPGADPVTVCASECDHQTIQAAIDDPSTDAGDTIVVLDPIHTEGAIVVNKNVTIEGVGALGTVVQAHISENAADDRVFAIAAGVSATIRKLTVQHGRVVGNPAMGGGILNQGTLVLDGVTVRNNTALGPDGNPGGTAEGGGIYTDGALQVVGSTVNDNEARAGDGTSGHDGGHARGGGLFSTDAGDVTLFNSTVSSNIVRGGAGGG